MSTKPYSATRRIVVVDLDKPRGVTRHQIKGLTAKIAEQLRAIVPLTDKPKGKGN